jgi:hypothetical protein
MDGTNVGTLSPASQSNYLWQAFSIPYVCNVAGNHTLMFAGLLTAGSYASCIDDVRIETNSVVPPERTFQVRFAPTTAGLRTATLSIASDDSNENPFTVTLTGSTPTGPAIALEQPAGNLLTMGMVSAWGFNGYGQASVPPGLKDIKAVAVGRYFTVALQADGTVTTWGQLTTPSLTGVAALSAGEGHAMALRSNGTVVVWGANEWNQTVVPPGLTNVAAIAAGGDGCAALRSNGTVVTWGYSLGTQPADLTNAMAVAKGLTHTLALRSNGTVVAWGENFQGEANVPAGLSGVVAIAAGGYGSAAVKSDGTIVEWAASPAEPAGLNGVKALAASLGHTLALRNDATIVAWGNNAYGQVNVPAGVMGVRAASAYGQYQFGDEGTSVALLDSTVDFGHRGIGGSGPTKTFTIRNTGPLPLNITNISLIGGDTSSFIISTAGMLSSVPVNGGATTFTVTFAPGTTGTKHTTLRVLNNDRDHGSYYVHLTGTGDVPPEIGVYTGTSIAPANARTSNVGTNVFANTGLGKSSVAQIFTITNTGIGNLTGLTVTTAGANAGDFVIGAPGVNTVAPGASTSFTVTFAPTALGVRIAKVNIPSNDGNEDPFVINVSGTGALLPDIAVFTGASTNVADLRTNNVGTNVFPNTLIGAASTAQTFTIKNVGAAALTGLSISKSGANPSDFGFGTLGAISLQPGASTTFTVTFAPTAAGQRSAAVDLASNDADENPFRINVSGTTITITGQPANTTACAGNTATFQVVVPGTGYTYQWQRRVRGGSTFANIPGATGSSYTTPAVGASDDGSGYQVTVFHGAQSLTSSQAVLSVITQTTPTAIYDFNAGLPANTAIYGDAYVSNNVLELNSNAAGKYGAFIIEDLAPTGPVREFVASFKVRMSGGNGFADGFSFNWAADLPNGTFAQAEEGEGTGLRVCFDTFNNGGNEGPAIDVKWGTNTIASYHTDNNFLPGNLNDFAEVAIRLNPEGSLDMTYRCVSIFTRLPLPGYTALSNARFGLGARTGGTYESHSIDDLAIEVNSMQPILDASVPGDPIVGNSTNSPLFQLPAQAIDNDVSTKYLNFDKLNAGLTITPSGQRPVRALTLISAEDAPERDPASFFLEGSLDGTNFARIISNAVPVFAARNTIQSFATGNTNVYTKYRVVFPRVVNNAAANSMQIAEVELLSDEEITSTNDLVSLSLPPGATDVRGVGMLFDRQLTLLRKFELWSLGTNSAIVDIIPAAGETVLKGFELIGGADDLAYPERRPSSVTVSGSQDGTNYVAIGTVIPAEPASNMQIQEFATLSNDTSYPRYRIAFGPPVSGNVLQVGELRLFGSVGAVVPPPPALSIRASGNNVQVSWTNIFGFSLETTTSLSPASWSAAGVTPVLSNGVNTVTVPATENSLFFRLRK